MDSLDDLFQPSTTSGSRPAGKFKPKSKLKPASLSTAVRPCTSATAQKGSTPLSSEAVSVGIKEAQSRIEGNGGQQKVPEPVEAEGNTTSLGLESIDGISPQTTTATSRFEPIVKAVPEYEKEILSSVIPEPINSLSSQHDVPIDGSSTRVFPPIDSSFGESSAHQLADSYDEILPAKDLECWSGAPHSEPVFSEGDDNSGSRLGCSGAESIVVPDDVLLQPTVTLVSSLVSTQSHSPQLGQSKETPSGTSVEAFSIGTLNSSLVELSPQLLTSKEIINPTVVLHEEKFSGNDGVLQRGQQSFREEVARASSSSDSDISVSLEPLSDILLQPVIATGQSLSKFVPKPIDQCKSKKDIASSSVISEAAVSVSDHIEGLEGYTHYIVQHSAPLELSISMHGISAQTSSSQQPVTSPSTVEPIYIPHPETHANGDFGIDAGSSAREEAAASPALDSINDILLEPATITSRGVGKFRPKSKSQTPTAKLFTPLVSSNNMEPISPPQKSHFLKGNECLKEASTDTFVHSVTIDSTSMRRCSQPGSQEAEDHFGLTSVETETAAVEAMSENHCSQPGNQEAEGHFVIANLEATTAGGEGDLQNVPDTLEVEGNVQEQRAISPSVKENEAGPRKRQRKKNNAIHTSIDEGQGVEDELHVSAAEDIEVGPTRRLRRRTTCASVDDIEDGNYEPSNISEEQHSDGDNDDYGSWGDKPKKKRLSKAAQKSVSETGNPVKRNRKKASEEPDIVKSEPTKKKFSHTTQRSKRSVNKTLLETPEEEIDPRKLTMKDLIMLAEFRERQSIKEAAAAKKFFPTSSADNSLRNDYPYDNDDPLASQDGFEPDDGPTTHRDEPVSKLNYHSFMKKTPKQRWSKSDTEMFYKALRQFGTDFAMIQQLFPGRTRHQVKLKFKAEERKHPLQLSDALAYRSKDHSHFELLIERLRSQVEQNSTKDDESLDMSVGNEEDAAGSELNQEEPKKNEQSRKEMKKDSADETQEEEKSSLEHEVESTVKSYESPDIYDWSQYRSADSFSPQDMEKDYRSVL